MEKKNLSINFKEKILSNLGEINSQLVEKEAGIVHSVEDFIIKVEKIWNGYEIKTSNMMEIYVDNKGKILGQKFDN